MSRSSRMVVAQLLDVAFYRQLAAGWIFDAGADGITFDGLVVLKDTRGETWPERLDWVLGSLIREGSVVLRAGRYYASAAGGSRRSGVVRNQAHAQREQGVTELCGSKGEG